MDKFALDSNVNGYHFNVCYVENKNSTKLLRESDKPKGIKTDLINCLSLNPDLKTLHVLYIVNKSRPDGVDLSTSALKQHVKRCHSRGNT